MAISIFEKQTNNRSINPENHPDSYEAFSSWITNFFQRNEGWLPVNIARWHFYVDKSHEELRKRIGGIRREGLYAIKSQQNPIAFKDAEPYINAIIEILPDYLSTYNFTKNVFLLPTTQQGSHASIKLSKHIKTHAEFKFKTGKISSSQIQLENKRLDTAITKLGELYARSRTSDLDLEVTMSTSPRSFVLLGHYGPDHDSCFRNGSDKTSHKFILGQSNDSFVVSIGRKTKDKYSNVARCFGWFSENYTVCNIANYYAKSGFAEGDGIEGIRKFLSDLWSDDVEMHEDISTISHGEIFHNPYGRWTFTKGKNSRPAISPLDLKTNSNGLTRFRCTNCHRDTSSDSNWALIDNDWFCSACIKNANTCTMSGQKTLKQLVSLSTKDGKTIDVHPNIIEKLHKCDICQSPHIDAIEINNQQICFECYDLNYSECENCQSIVPDSEFIDDGNFDICLKCFKQGVSPFEINNITCLLEFENVSEDLVGK